MAIGVAELAGSDARAPLRRKAWEALGKWIASRINRQRGVHVPNLFQISWRLLATDDTGSKLRQPVFVLSERFSDAFGVKQAGVPERNLPPPVQGDEVNFYQLAIQHSEGLTKDHAFASVRDMLFRLGEAASQGRELRLDMGAGTLVILEKEASFEFKGGGRAGDAGGATSKTSHLDPMLNGKKLGASADLASAGLALGGVGVGAGAGRGTPSAISVARSDGGAGKSAISAEEEAALFADVDALDPESALSVLSGYARRAPRRYARRGARRADAVAGRESAAHHEAVGDHTVEHWRRAPAAAVARVHRGAAAGERSMEAHQGTQRWRRRQWRWRWRGGANAVAPTLTLLAPPPTASPRAPRGQRALPRRPRNRAGERVGCRWRRPAALPLRDANGGRRGEPCVEEARRRNASPAAAARPGGGARRSGRAGTALAAPPVVATAAVIVARPRDAAVILCCPLI